MRLDIGGGRSRIVAAASLGALALVAVGTVAAVPPAHAAAGCSVDYSVSSQWPGGFGANVTIKNLGDPVTSWTLTFSFGAGQTITSLWNGVVTQSGSSVSVKDTGWNAALGTGGTASFGFNGAFSGSNPAPTNFALNGTACTGSVSGSTGSSTTSSAPVTTTTTTSTNRPTTTTTTTTTTTNGTAGRSQLVTPSGKCLDAGGTSNGSNVVIRTCNGSAQQQWQYTGNREWTTLNGALCLDASGRGTANGTPIIVWNCTGGTNQQWNWGSNNTTIVGVGSGRCLDVPNGSSNDGTTLQLYDCWGGDPQKWTYQGNGQPPVTTTTTRTTTTTSNNNNASQLYVDPSNAGSVWLSQNGGDYRASVIRNRITSQPQAIWITEGTNANASAQRTANYINAARSAGRIPMVVLYALPNRDCGGASAGGASDLNAYGQWVQTVARQLGNQRVYVILEPDSLALQTCLSSSEAQARGNALSQAITTIKNANSQAKVYLDAGHSLWNSPSVTAQRLSQAGVSKSDGFYTNVSNFQPTSNEISFGRQVLSALGNPGNLKQVIDTSRNGGSAGSDWCDDNLPSGRRLGQAPTLNTGQSTVEAFMWIKLPGEADGCSKRPGTFYPENAYSLAGGNG